MSRPLVTAEERALLPLSKWVNLPLLSHGKRDLSSLDPEEKKIYREWQYGEWRNANKEAVKASKAKYLRTPKHRASKKAWNERNKDKIRSYRTPERQQAYQRKFRRARYGRVCTHCGRNDGQTVFASSIQCCACRRMGELNGYCSCGSIKKKTRKGKLYCPKSPKNSILLELVREADGPITYHHVMQVKGNSPVAAKRYLQRIEDRLKFLGVRFNYEEGGGDKGITKVHIDIASLKRALGEKAA